MAESRDRVGVAERDQVANERVPLLVDELLLITQPGHLQKVEGRTLKTKERDRARARCVRAKLAGEGRAANAAGTSHE